MNQLPSQPSQTDLRNLIIAVVLSTGLLFMWQQMYAEPKEAARREMLQREREQAETAAPGMADADVILPEAARNLEPAEAAMLTPSLSRAEALADAPRIPINAPAVHGSINLQGLRFDDLTLDRHRVRIAEDSPDVVLLSPAQTAQRYFIQVGWLPSSRTQGLVLPDSNTLWRPSGSELTPGNPVTFHWENPQGIAFDVRVALDEDYLFTITQTVINPTGESLSLMPYGLINRARPTDGKFGAILHTGPIAVVEDTLLEVPYDEIEDDRKQQFTDVKGWLGIADKYWLTAFIPEGGDRHNLNIQYMAPEGRERVQVDFLSEAVPVPAGGSASETLHLFAGAKELNVLEKYAENLDIPLFDRALDFGVLYFLTYPIFKTLTFFYHLLGNFGLAIMLFVVLLKVILFPLSNKSYVSMAKMRKLQPELERIKKQNEHDKLKLQQEMMALWQKEKVNPVSGCFPILIQLPIFFALYKVLLVTIEMRHAPFYGWIQDLSAKDPTNLFTLFGLVEWGPPGWMHLGALPIIMCATMVLQQKLNPKPTDPIQAKVIGMLPYLFLILFAAFPAGLLLYWAWNNILSILQQAFIMRRFEKQDARKLQRGDA